MTPSVGRIIDKLSHKYTIMAALHEVKKTYEKHFWKFDRIEIENLSTPEAKKLIRQHATGADIEDYRMTETCILQQSAGNPRAIIEIVERLRKEPAVTRSTVRHVSHTWRPKPDRSHSRRCPALARSGRGPILHARHRKYGRLCAGRHRQRSFGRHSILHVQVQTMTAPTHIVFGLLTAAGSFSLFSMPLHRNLPAVACAILGSVLPDIDSPNSYIGRVLPYASIPIERQWGHRTITHSLLCLLGLSVIIWPLAHLANPVLCGRVS